MKLGANHGPHLTYGLNVHPGESWEENLAAIRTYTLKVKRIVAPSVPFGLGLRLSRRAARSLADPSRRVAFKAFLREHDVYGMTVNAFPYGRFHGVPVKEKVYQPNWRRAERMIYTKQVADVLADLLPDGVSGSISTVPLGYGRWDAESEIPAPMIRHLADVAVHCARIRDRCGREVHVGLEPEPDCLLETTEQTLAFFEKQLFPRAVPLVAERIGCSNKAAEDRLRRHIGVCFDTCHQAVLFEDIPRSLARLADAGIRISKVQLSAAVKTGPGRSSRDARDKARERFADPVYLHQVKARGPDGVLRSLGDLGSASGVSGNADSSADEWRVHVHIPLHARPGPGLASTADVLDRRFFDTVRRLRIEQLEIETYTFDVLPAGLRQGGLVASLAAEIRWVCDRWPS